MSQSSATHDLLMIGAGRMGAGLVRRLLRAGVSVGVTDVSPESVSALEELGAAGYPSIEAMFSATTSPRAVWVMVPAGDITSAVLREVADLVQTGDIVIDGGNSRYVDAIARAEEFASRGATFLDVGTSGGVWGDVRGFCLMIGGDTAAVNRLRPIWDALAPGVHTAERTNSAVEISPQEMGWLHCGPSGAGHFVKMVHNGIEYGAMAAYAEGLNILANADAGTKTRQSDAETSPLSNPEHYQYDFDLSAITEVWRRGSVVASWLLDLTAAAFAADHELAGYQGRVSDSGEGRWTIDAAVDIGVPAPVLASALFSRFASRGNDETANKVLSAMRKAFGGHLEKPH